MPQRKRKRVVKQKLKPAKDEATAAKQTKNRKLVSMSFLMYLSYGIYFVTFSSLLGFHL